MKKQLLVALASCYCFSSYSNEVVYGTTGNAAPDNAYHWAMQNVLPQQAGLTVGSVIYRYTTVKEAESAFTVTVQNEDASGNGYIFQEVDDWTGLPGNTINKVVSVGDVPIQRWGDGSIVESGEGIVTNQNIFYTYKYDPCFDPQSNPSCPGYLPPVEAFEYEIYNPLDDEFIKMELEKESYREDEERQRKKSQEKQKQKERLEVALGAVDSALLTAQNVAIAAELIALNPTITAYYKSIPGGTYEDSVSLKDRQLPDNPKSKRAQLAQEVLHQEMVNSQYKSSTGGLK
jgi:hypothetical protein